MKEGDQEFLERLMQLHDQNLRAKFISGSDSHPDQSLEDMSLEELLQEIYQEAIDTMHYAGAALLKLRQHTEPAEEPTED